MFRQSKILLTKVSDCENKRTNKKKLSRLLLPKGFRGEAPEPHAAEPLSGIHRVQMGLTGQNEGERQTLAAVNLSRYPLLLVYLNYQVVCVHVCLMGKCVQWCTFT